MDVIERLVEIVKIPSINPPGDEAGVADLLEEWLDAAGIERDAVPVPGKPGRRCVMARVAKSPSQKGEKPLVFTGHMDVVPISEDERTRWLRDPFCAEIVDGELWGRGSSDMKGGLACALEALILAADEKEAGRLLKRDIVLAATVDEEFNMTGSRALLAHPWLAEGGDLVVCEPTAGLLCTSSRGRTWAEITLKGKTAHGSRRGVGINAVHVAAELIRRLEQEDFSDTDDPRSGETFWQALKIHAGIDPGIVPDRCVLEVDSRLSPITRTEDIWKRMTRILEQMRAEGPSFEYGIRVCDRREPWETAEDYPLVRALDEIAPNTPRGCFSGSTDGNILREAGLVPVIFGPGNLDLVHRENERVSVEEVRRFRQIYCELVEKMFA